VSEKAASTNRVVVSGMRPTGRLHLGHLLGTLSNWVRLQDEFDCYFFVADWHVLTTDYERPDRVSDFVHEMVIDWLAAGLDPERCVIFRQSEILEHAELALLLGMLTPVSWLERNPTYKEQRSQLEGKDLSTMGFLGYPVLQAADILVYKGGRVPVGEDQVPHVELTRDIARRFNNYYGAILPEPEALLSPAPRLPGTDGRKMSKSYGNAIVLDEDPASIESRLGRMPTDPRRVRRKDPGDPAECPAFALHRIYCTPEEIEQVSEGCRTAGIGCLDCKKVMIPHVIEALAPLREGRAQWEAKPERVSEILAAGTARARAVAQRTMEEVREAIGIA
jgi:tryptophanyl-tRNA synthetase